MTAIHQCYFLSNVTRFLKNKLMSHFWLISLEWIYLHRIKNDWLHSKRMCKWWCHDKFCVRGSLNCFTSRFLALQKHRHVKSQDLFRLCVFFFLRKNYIGEMQIMILFCVFDTSLFHVTASLFEWTPMIDKLKK